MFKQLIAVWFVVAAAIAVTAGVLPSVDIDGGILALLGLALLFGLVNALVGPLLRFISIPLNAITIGFFSLVVNAALLSITAGLSDSLDVGGFFSAVVAAIVISLVSAVLVVLVGRLSTTSEPEFA